MPFQYFRTHLIGLLPASETTRVETLEVFNKYRVKHGISIWISPAIVTDFEAYSKTLSQKCTILCTFDHIIYWKLKSRYSLL